MTAKQYLSQIAYKQHMIRETEDNLNAIRATAETAGAIRYDKDLVQTSPSNDALTNYVIAIENTERRLFRLKEDYLSFYMTVWEQINSMDAEGNYKEILYFRYVKRMQLRDVADEMGYEYSWTCRMHGRALQVFERQYGPF